MIDPSDPMWKAIVAERDSLRARVLQMHAANSELLHDAEGLRAQLHLANVDAANREAEANDLRAQLAAAQRVAIVGACHCGITHLALDSIDSGMAETCPTCGDVIVFDVQSPEARAQQFVSVPADAELDAIVDDIVTESAFCDSNGWSRTSLMLERAHESITALRRRVAEADKALRDMP